MVGNKPYKWVKLGKLLQELGALDNHIHERPRFCLSETRANMLAARIARYQGSKVHVIGHSAGGLDIRHALHNHPNLQKYIASITTMGSPHKGTAIADRYLERLEKIECDEYLFGKFTDKDAEFAEKFAGEMTRNQAAINDSKWGNPLPDITFCLPGYIDSKWKVPLLSWDGYEYLCEQGYHRNDGTVPLSSQTHGHVIEIVKSGHLSQSFPVRYGWPWQKPYKDNFELIINNLKKLEAGLL